MKNFYAFLVLLLIGNFGFGQITENFDTGLAGSYTTGSQTLTSGTWTTSDVIAETAGNSRGATGSAARLNDDTANASITTPTLSGGADVVSFWYRELNTGGGTFSLQTSTDGTTYTTQTTQAYSGTTYAQFTYTVNDPSPTLTIRVLIDNQLGHLIIDDFDVTAFPVNSLVIGTGTTTTGSTDEDPIHGYYNAFRYQVVYTAAELSTTLTINDEITALGWSIAGDYGGGNLLGYTIKMGHTTATNSATHDNSTTTVVKNAFNYDPTVTAAGVFDMIPFDTNFVWNGVDNVLVEVCSDGSNPFSGPYGQVRTTTTTSGSRSYRVDGGTACGVNTNTTNPDKPNIQFDYIDGIAPACFDVTALTVDSFTDTTATISWTAGNTETAWEIAVQLDGTGVAVPPVAATGTTTNPHTTSGLLERTDYEVYVRADCGVDGFSNWVGPITFTTAPSCPDVTAITIDSFTDTTATVSWTAGDTETDWEIVVQADGTGEPSGAGTATTTNPHTESGLTQLTDYEVYVRSDCDTDGFGIWVGPVTFTTAPSCPDITALTLDTATDTSGTISWTAGGTETAWEIVVQADGTGIPGGAGTATTTNPHTETGLTASTDYEVYVRADCTGASNGYSGWVGPIDFSTTSAPVTVFPYNENFEGGAAGWTLDNTTNGTWQLGNPVNTIINVADTGANAWVTNLTGDYNTNETSYVISPPFNFTSLAAPVIQLSVWYSSENTYDGALLQSSIDNGNTWQNVGANGDPNNWYNNAIGWTGTSGGWLVAEHDLTGLGGQSSVFLRVAFDSDGSTNGEGVAFDTVNIFQPSCPDITALAIDSFTDTDAVISWTAGNTETDWEIVVQADGTGVPAGAGTATTTNPYSASGLTAETAYEVYVRADCGAGGISGWVGPVDFTSQAACPDISGLTLDSSTATSATISWTEGSIETAWEIVVQADGTGIPTVAGTATSTNPHTESGLTSETAYEVYVRADCTSASDGYSNWVGPLDFTTPCAIFIPDYTEDFTTFLNPCWDRGGDGDLTTGPATFGTSNWIAEEFAHTSTSGGGAVNINMYVSNDVEWLLSPFFDLSAGGYEVVLDVALTDFAATTTNDTFDADDEVRLLYSLDGTNWTTLQLWNQANTPSSTGDTVITDISTITGSNVQFALYAAENTGTSAIDIDFHIDNFKVRIPPSCLDITALTIDSFTDTTAAISWTAGDTETDWEIVVQADGTGVPTGAGTSTTTNPYTESGLTVETAYEVYVRADCGANGFSTWVGPLDFTTACAAITALPWTEDVEATSPTLNCWSIINNNADGDSWVTSTVSPNSGAQSFRINTDFNGGSNDDYLVTPQLTLTGNERLKFQQRVNSAGEPNDFTVLLSTTGATPADFTNTILANASYSNTSYQEIIVDLSAYTGDVYIAFHVPPGGLDGWILYIDDIIVEAIPPCLDVTALTLDNVTDSSATISWTAGDTETDWEIVVQADGTGVPTGSGTATTTNPYTDSTLSALTAYEAYVRADCGVNGFSNWVGPLTFSTLATSITVFPYYEDFESGPGDWTADNTTNGTWELGAPTNTIINSADSGSTAWVTDLDGTYNANEDSYVISPPFDFSTLVAPEIEFSIWWNSEFSWDGMVLQSSIDNGSTWQVVGANGDPDNWYNDNTIGGSPGGQSLGWTGRNSTGNGSAGWVVAKHALTGLGGQSSVILRVAFAADGSAQDEGVAFDTVTISQPACPDVTTLAVDSFTDTAATISWTDGNTETDWEIVIQADGTGVPTGAGTATTTNPHTDSSLTENTAYEVYVRANCLLDGFSEWVGPVDFTTLCSNIVPEYIADMSTNVPDACWDESNDGEIAAGPSGSGTSDWTTGSYSVGSSNRINLFSNVDREWLLSPTFDLSTGGPFQLELNVAVTDFAGTADDTMGSDDEVQLLSSIDGGTTWVNITTWNAANEPLFTGTEYIADLTAYTGNVQFAIWASDGTVDDTEDYNFHVGQFIVRTPPTCLDISGLTIDSFTPSEVTVSWTNGDTETAWEIAVQADGTGSPTGAGTATTTNPHTESGLTGETAYEVYVRADCAANGFSAWIGPVDFTTPCDYTIPNYFADMSVNVPDSCWDQATNGEVATGPTGLGSSSWTSGGSGDDNNYGAAIFSNRINLYGTTAIRDWLISPVFDLSTGGPFQLELNVAVTDYNNGDTDDTMGADDEVQLLSSTDGGTTWVNITTWNVGNEPDFTGTEYIADLTAYTGNVQFAIWGSNGTASGTDYDFHVGQFIVRTPPTCIDITGLTIDSFTATDVTVSWTAGATETAWEIAVQADGTGTPAGAGTATTTNPHTESGLTAETAYEVYVRADCGVDGFSAWVGPVTFTTACASETVFPFTEDFENAGAIPDCWTSSSSTSRVWAFATSPTFGNSYSDNTTGTGYFAYVDASTATTTTDATLTSNTFDVSGLTTPLLEFYVHHFVSQDTNSNTITVEVYDGAAWNVVYTDNNGDVDGWEEVSVDLSTLTITGDIQIRFIVDTATSSNFYNDIAIDDVSVIEAPTCLDPTGLTVDSFTRDSATISWTAGDTETDWEVVVQPDGTGVPAGAGTATTANPYTETGLTAATAYEVYVRADCGVTDGLSVWAGPLTFTTANPLPTTTATLDITACGPGNEDSYNGAYDASVSNIVWAQLNYTGSCFSLTVDTILSDFDTEIGIYDANGVLIGSNDEGGTGIDPQSLFTEIGLANGTYYIAAGAANTTFGPDFNVTSTNTTTTGTLYINASTPSNDTIDYCNLQFPNSGTITEGATWDVYAQVFQAGITEAAGQGATIDAWIGYSTTDATTTADFATGWTWVPATYSGDVGNNDEYLAEIGSTLTPGLYYYASRFTVNSGGFAYGGINPGSTGGNFWNGTTAVSGQLTVNSANIPTTVATFNIDGCGDSDSYNGAYASATDDVVWVELIYDGNCTEITVDTESTTGIDTEIGLYDQFGNFISSDDDGGTGSLSTITTVGLAAGTYYIVAGAFNTAFNADFDASTTDTADSGTLYINASTPNFVDFCNLQSPSSGSINVGGNYDVFAQIFEGGVTEAAGQGANIVSWIGYNTTDAITTADFASGWTWVPATYNTDVGNNDEYQAEIGSGLAVGSYFYVSRFSVDGGDFAYGGINPGSTDGNFWDGTNYVSGQLTVNPTPEPTNHVLAFTAVADSDSQITLTWNDNDGAVPAEAFVIVGKTGAGVFTTIVDGTAVANDVDWSDDEFEFNRASGAQNYTVVGLDASTLYEFEIYPYTNSGVLIDFKTDGTIPSTSATTGADPCLVAVTTFPFEEGFETGLIPQCWSQEVEAGAANWTYNNGAQGGTITSAYNGSFNALFYDTTRSGVVKLVSPKLDITGITSPTLSFWHAQEAWGADQDELRVYYKTSEAGAWTLIPGLEYLTSIDAWTQETIELPNPSADYYIAFEGSGDWGRGVVLDDVKVEEVIAVTYTYTGAWAPSDPNGTATTNDDIIIASGDAVISSNTSALTVTVNPGASITVNTGVTLTVSNDVTLESISNSYSSLINDGTITGTIKYERFVNFNAGGNDLVSAPLAGETWANFLLSDTNAADLLDNGATSPTTYAWAPFDKSVGAYVNYTDATVATLTSGTGYRAATDPVVGTGTTLTFTGTVPTGDVLIDITDAGPNHPDWNLVGNPYPSYVDMFNFLFHEVVPASGVFNYQLLADESGIYGYDGDAANGYDVVTLANAFGRLMAPGQGFLVAADDTQVAAYDLTFRTSMRATGGGDDFIAGRSANDALAYFKLKANTATDDYLTQFYFNDESSQGADQGYDGKVWGTPPSFALYSHLVQDNNDVAMALQSLNTSDMMDVVIPLGVNANSGEQLTFTISESTLPSTVEVYLDDTLNNTSTLLNNSDYVITPSTNLNGTGRFYLRVGDSSLSTTDIDFNNIKIYTKESPRSIFIQGVINSDDATAKIHDIQGRLVYSTDLENRNLINEIDASELQDGVYVVTLTDGSKQKSQKVIIR